MPYFGEKFCQRFERAWRNAATFQSGPTSNNYFKAARTAFLLIGRRGAAEPTSAEGTILRGFRDGPKWIPSDQEWAAILANLAGAILTLSDDSFISKGSAESRNKKFESLRSALRWLSGQGLIPEIELEGNRLREEFGAASKCLATIKFEAGRFDISGLSLREASNRFSTCNREMLDELRKQLWIELKENLDLYEQGQVLMSDPTLPDFPEVENLLTLYSRVGLRSKKHHETLGFSRQQALGLALKIFRHRSIKGNSTSLKAIEFARSIIGNDEAQPYYEATNKSLNAAYHIILIDLGANCQPTDDIPYECYSDKPRRGRIRVRSVRLNKNRSNGKAVPGVLKEDISETELFLATKNLPDRPSGVVIIEIWKKLTASMRSRTGLTAERLWVWRNAGWSEVRTSLVSMSSDRWPAFLARHAENEVFGGLQITRQSIRTAVRNARGEAGHLDIAVEQALMGHSSAKTTFEYLSEGATRSLLESQIRDFIDAWEAVSVRDIDSAAQLLGIPSAELSNRAQLGIENGLAILASRAEERTSSAPRDSSPVLSKAAQEFSISTVSMTNLELARRALRQQFEIMVNVNPQRFVRKWLPWMAIVEGYCARLEQSRFRLQFSRVCKDVDQHLYEGSLRIPLLW
ncbi:hypothetical protein C8K44_12750 [Aminobacter sp. AP02]|nr:hypothetical protein C8K44_12750 [Aminobacter sp. AP02]